MSILFWLGVGFIVYCLAVLSFYFVSLGALYFSTAALDREVASYLKFCREHGTMVEDEYIEILRR